MDKSIINYKGVLQMECEQCGTIYYGRSCPVCGWCQTWGSKRVKVNSIRRYIIK